MQHLDESKVSYFNYWFKRIQYLVESAPIDLITVKVISFQSFILGIDLCTKARRAEDRLKLSEPDSESALNSEHSRRNYDEKIE